MYKLDFNTPAKLHFTGIGGISMSALAAVSYTHLDVYKRQLLRLLCSYFYSLSYYKLYLKFL